MSLTTLAEPDPDVSGDHDCRAPSAAQTTSRIMIIDDEPINIRVVRKYLSLAGYSDFIETTDATAAWTLLNKESPDLILLDIMMPRISGLDILQRLREDERHRALPVLILTAADDRAIKSRALELGATDFLAKPVDPVDLVPRVRNALVLKAHHDHLQRYACELEREVSMQTAELARSQLQVIHCLARAAEYRDNQTGQHVIRVGRYAGIIARELGWREEQVRLLQHAAVLHDVGKIGVPDSILLKPGKLAPEEVELMQKHCAFGRRIFERMSSDEFESYCAHTTVGAQIIESCRTPLLELAGRIALTHHERWDGTGYPLGLAADDIPLEGRITMVADVFDALSSQRPYKPAFSLERCFGIMEEGRSSQLDPTVLDAFFARRDEIVRVQLECPDLD